jgi:predicted dehydrogenase
VPEIDVAAIADLDPEPRSRCDLPERVVRVPGVGELLTRDLDAIAICTPPDSHSQIALAALGAGRHVLVEKPPALTVEEAERLTAAIPLGLVGACGFNLRGHRLVRRARALIGAGTIGRPRSVHGVFLTPPAASPGWRAVPDRGGDPLLDRAIHHVDLWRFLLADDVVESSVSPVAGGLAVAGRLAGGAHGRADALDGASSQTIRVEGDEGRLTLDLYRAGALALQPASARSLVERGRALAGRPRGGDVLASYREQWRTFAAAVRGEGVPLADLDDGRRALAAVLAGQGAVGPVPAEMR